MELGGESKHQNKDSLRNCAEFRWPVRYRGRLGRLFQSLERPEPMSIARAVGLAVTSTAVVLKQFEMEMGKIGLLGEYFDDTHNRGCFQQFQTALYLASYLTKLADALRFLSPWCRSSGRAQFFPADGVNKIVLSSTPVAILKRPCQNRGARMHNMYAYGETRTDWANSFRRWLPHISRSKYTL